MPPINPAQQRAVYIHNIHNTIMYDINRERNEIYHEAVIRLCIYNQNLLGAKTPTFVFNNKWYSMNPLPAPKEMENWNRKLHPSLLDDLVTLTTQQDFDQRTQEAILSGFFANILMECVHIHDFDKLIPSSFACHFNLDPKVFNTSDIPLNAQQIAEIQRNNEVGIQCLNKIALTNLLLQKV